MKKENEIHEAFSFDSSIVCSPMVLTGYCVRWCDYNINLLNETMKKELTITINYRFGSVAEAAQVSESISVEPEQKFKVIMYVDTAKHLIENK